MRRFAGATLAFALILGGCYTAYLWIFHGWAASTGPASIAGDAQRAWHHAWSVRFLVATCALLVAAVIWGARGHWRHPKHVDFRWTSHQQAGEFHLSVPRMQRPSLSRILLTVLGMTLGAVIGFVAGSALSMFFMQCEDPTYHTCADPHGFLSLGLGLLFGLPIGAMIGGWNAYHLVGWLASRPAKPPDAA